jgi:hypothetical protein
VHAPVSAPHLLVRDGPTVSYSSLLAVPGGSSDGERSSSEGAWSTRAVTGDSLCSSQSASVSLFLFYFLIFVLLLSFTACPGRL